MASDTPESEDWAAKKLAEVLSLEKQERLAEESPPEELKEIFRVIDYDVLPILDASGVAITREELTRMFAQWYVRRGSEAREEIERVEEQAGAPNLVSPSGARRLLASLGRSGGPIRRLLRTVGIVIMLVPIVLLPAYFLLSTQLPPPVASGILTIAPAAPLIAPGQTQNYTVLTLTQPVSGSSLPTTLTAFSPSGLSFKILQTSVPTQATTLIPVVMHTSTTIALGKYLVTVEEKQGSSVRNQTFTVTVVSALVIMQHLAFVPRALNVAEGTTVYWMNLDSVIGCCDPGIHNVDFTAGMSVLSPNLGTRGVWSFRFGNAGDFYYICSIHPFMTGEVRVTA